MKIVTRIGLFGVVAGMALSGRPLWAAPVDAPADAPPAATPAAAPIAVTRDNFVSLSWGQTGGFAGISSTAGVQGNIVSRSNPRRGGDGAVQNANLPETRGLSTDQRNRFIDKIKEANLPALVGSYRQQGLMDGFNETLILTLSDENGEDQKFTISNYGGTAPQAYLDFVQYFREFLDKKFASRQLPM